MIPGGPREGRCGIGNARFEPGMDFERGAGGVIGLRNAEIDPARLSGRALGIRMTGFETGRALERGSRGVFGHRNAEIDPVRPSGRAFGLRNGEIAPAATFMKG